MNQFIAEENDIIIGFASGLTNHNWFYLSDMWVHEDYRRQGLGAKLLSLLEEKVKSIGVEHIWTWTTGFIKPKFYENQDIRFLQFLKIFAMLKAIIK